MCKCIYLFSVNNCHDLHVNCTVFVDSIHCIEYHNRSLSHSLAIFFLFLLLFQMTWKKHRKTARINAMQNIELDKIKMQTTAIQPKSVAFYSSMKTQCTHQKTTHTHTNCTVANDDDEILHIFTDISQLFLLFWMSNVVLFCKSSQ